MEDQWQRALSDVVRAELALTDRTAKDAYTALGISSTAWQTYFKQRSRDIPSRVLLDLARYLGMPLSELSARAERRQAELERSIDPIAAELEAGLSPRARRAVAEAREQLERERRGNGGARSEDPPDATVERTRHSA